MPSSDPDIVAIPLTLLYVASSCIELESDPLPVPERGKVGVCHSFVSSSSSTPTPAKSPVNLDDVPGGRRARSAEWGGIGNLSWVADPSSKVAMVVFNSALPYGSEVSSLFACRRPTRHRS